MFFHQRFIPGLAIASYIVGDEKTKEMAVIDPTRDIDYYLDIARAERMRISHVLETHVHADYLSGAAQLKARLDNQVAVHCSKMGGEEWTPPYADRLVGNADDVRLGQIRLQALHTPGHTPEHISWLLFDTARSADTPWMFFTGDFIFVGDVGRPDLLGEAERQKMAEDLYDSIFERIAPLPDFVEVFPTHGAGSLCGKAIGSRRSSTLGFERRFNGSMQAKPRQEWIDNLLRDMPLAPPYFKRMKQLNSRGPAILGPDLPGQRPLRPRDFADRIGGDALVLDIRPKEAFAASHIPGALNIPLAPNLPSWAGWVIPPEARLLIVAEEPADVADAVTHLIRIGLDNVEGHLDGGMDAWQTSGQEVGHLETLSVHELHRRQQEAARGDGAPLVLDVRTDSEWARGHIEGARHVHAGLLGGRLEELPRDRLIAVTCGSGYRASMAASILRRGGLQRVANVLGGMSAWQAAKLPVTTES